MSGVGTLWSREAPRPCLSADLTLKKGGTSMKIVPLLCLLILLVFSFSCSTVGWSEYSPSRFGLKEADKSEPVERVKNFSLRTPESDDFNPYENDIRFMFVSRDGWIKMCEWWIAKDLIGD